MPALLHSLSLRKDIDLSGGLRVAVFVSIHNTVILMASNVFSNFDTRQLERRLYMLLDDFSAIDPVFGKITAAKHFLTNYASIDIFHNIWLFVFYALLADYGDKSATIHDWLYSGYGITQADWSIYYPTRKECDQIMYRLLRAEGVARWRAWMFYAGVRIGGASHYTFRADRAVIAVRAADYIDA